MALPWVKCTAMAEIQLLMRQRVSIRAGVSCFALESSSTLDFFTFETIILHTDGDKGKFQSVASAYVYTCRLRSRVLKELFVRRLTCHSTLSKVVTYIILSLAIVYDHQ